VLTPLLMLLPLIAGLATEARKDTKAAPVVASLEKVCGKVRAWPKEKQAELRVELSRLPPSHVFRDLAGDWLDSRDEIRICRGEKAPTK
jgi:hypothetical protein